MAPDADYRIVLSACERRRHRLDDERPQGRRRWAGHMQRRAREESDTVAWPDGRQGSDGVGVGGRRMTDKQTINAGALLDHRFVSQA